MGSRPIKETRPVDDGSEACGQGEEEVSGEYKEPPIIRRLFVPFLMNVGKHLGFKRFSLNRIYSVVQVNTKFLLSGIIWLLLWVVPWGESLRLDGNLYLAFIVDMIKLGIALFLFILPGALFFVLMRDKNVFDGGQWSVFPVGFAISTTIIGILGLAGRILGLSFVTVKYMFMSIGLGELILLALLMPDSQFSKMRTAESIRRVIENSPLLLAITLAIATAFNGYQFFIDDTTYAAYVTNWRFSTQLGFSNIVYHNSVVEIPRFWLALYPMGQALLSDLSGVPVILLFSNYLELFLVPLALLTAYWFARFLGLSRKMAGLSVVLQTLFYVFMIDDSWPVGFWFFQNMVEDKVTAVFLLAPVFFFFGLMFLQFPTKKFLFLFFLCGIGLMLTHPVILFLACAMTAGMMLISLLFGRTRWRDVFQLLGVIVIVLMPYTIIRFYDLSQADQFDAKSVSTTFQADRYINIVSDVFYGLNPDVLLFSDISPESDFYSAFQIVRLFPVLLTLIAGYLAFRKIKNGVLYWYILVCVLIVAFAAIPYTGWMLGYFISARMISRVSWFLPLGLAGVLVILLTIERLKASPFAGKIVKVHEHQTESSGNVGKNIISLVFAALILAPVILYQAQYYFDVLDHNQQLARVGSYIDQITDSPTVVIALDYSDIQMLPGVSAHANLISFREEVEYNGFNNFLPLDEVRAMIYASNTIRSLDPNIRLDERCDLIKKYHVEFVLAPSDKVDEYGGLIGACGTQTSFALETKDLILMEIE